MNITQFVSQVGASFYDGIGSGTVEPDGVSEFGTVTAFQNSEDVGYAVDDGTPSGNLTESDIAASLPSGASTCDLTALFTGYAASCDEGGRELHYWTGKSVSNTVSNSQLSMNGVTGAFPFTADDGEKQVLLSEPLANDLATLGGCTRVMSETAFLGASGAINATSLPGKMCSTTPSEGLGVDGVIPGLGTVYKNTRSGSGAAKLYLVYQDSPLPGSINDCTLNNCITFEFPDRTTIQGWTYVPNFGEKNYLVVSQMDSGFVNGNIYFYEVPTTGKFNATMSPAQADITLGGSSSDYRLGYSIGWFKNPATGNSTFVASKPFDADLAPNGGTLVLFDSPPSNGSSSDDADLKVYGTEANGLLGLFTVSGYGRAAIKGSANRMYVIGSLITPPVTSTTSGGLESTTSTSSSSVDTGTASPASQLPNIIAEVDKYVTSWIDLIWGSRRALIDTDLPDLFKTLQYAERQLNALSARTADYVRPILRQKCRVENILRSGKTSDGLMRQVNRELKRLNHEIAQRYLPTSPMYRPSTQSGVPSLPVLESIVL